MDILNSRKSEDVTEWLKRQPSLHLITRDGSKTYAKAVAEVSSTIKQIADRWHILRQLFEATKEAVCITLPSEWRPTSSEVAQKAPEPIKTGKRKTDQVRIQYEEKHWNRIKQVQELYAQKYKITAIAKKLNLSRGTVYKDLRTKEKPKHRRHSRFDFIRPTIQLCLEKRQSGTQIEKACREQGYTGSTSTLNRFIAEERRSIKKTKTDKPFVLRQKVMKIMWDFDSKDHVKDYKNLHPDLLKTFPALFYLDRMIFSLHTMMEDRQGNRLTAWIQAYRHSPYPSIRSFLYGVEKDMAAVQAGITEPWSNGVTEGHVNRLKMVKRMMYGRGNFEVLRSRVLYQWS